MSISLTGEAFAASPSETVERFQAGPPEAITAAFGGKAAPVPPGNCG